MKKIKWTLLSAAILFSIGSAYTTRPGFDCSNDTQYYYSGGSYFPAGEEGVDYTCQAGSNTCTYYTSDGIHFFACATGLFNNCVGCTPGNPLTDR